MIRTILIILVVILVISYFGINLRALVSSPTTQDNVSYVVTGIGSIWNNYLKMPATYLWKEVFINLIWSQIISNMNNSRLEGPPAFSSTTPSS